MLLKAIFPSSYLGLVESISAALIECQSNAEQGFLECITEVKF